MMNRDDIKYADFTAELCGEFDAATFTNENPEISLERAVQVQVFGRNDSSGMNPEISMDSSMGIMGPSSGHPFTKYENANVFLQVPFSLSKKTVFEEERSSVFPDRPCFLVRTHFAISFEKNSFDFVVQTIDAALESIPKFDFSFFASEAMWKGKHFQGSIMCEVHIRVYHEGQGQYIVEANRVKGDAKPFSPFFKELKSILTKTPVETKTALAFMSQLSSGPISDSQFLMGIRPIFFTALEPYLEARIEGAKMLCDLALHDSSHLRLDECRSQVLSVLEKLVVDDFDDVKHHAIMALSAFSSLDDIPQYKEGILASTTLLQVLLEFSQDAPAPAYETIKVRRECAHVVFLLSEFNAATAFSKFEKCCGTKRMWHILDSGSTSTHDARLRASIASARDNFIKKVSK